MQPHDAVTTLKHLIIQHGLRVTVNNLAQACRELANEDIPVFLDAEDAKENDPELTINESDLELAAGVLETTDLF